MPSSAGDVLRRAGRDQFAAPVAALRSEVDDPVGGLDDVEVVFDDDDGVPLVAQPVQDLQQLLDVVKCSPVVGSSRMYSVLPVSRFDSSRDSLIRCASPPDSVVAFCPRRI
jgi:hypothetical protein